MVRSADDVDGGRVPSDVFLRTQAGLGAIVSQRVASGVLSRVLEQRGVDPESVDGPQMRELLLGPVLLDLQSVLPESGLRRHLELLARSLQRDVEVPDDGTRDFETHDVERPDEDHQAAPEEDPSGSLSSEPADTPATDARDEGPDSGDASVPLERDHVTDPGQVDEHSEAADQAEAGPVEPHSTLDRQTAHPAEASDETSRLEPAEARHAPPAPIAGRPAPSPEVWESHISTLARLDNIRTIAVIRDGNPLVGRGDGIDVHLLARLSRVAFRLLEKASPVRSLQLRHSEGVLLAWELGGDLLVLHGNTSLNIGAVTTTLASLLQEESV